MRTTPIPVALAASALFVAGCGGSGSSSTASGSKAAGAAIPGPVKIYRTKLSGGAEPNHGAPSGTGDAIIAIHTNSDLCWRFAHLHGFSGATSARIYNAPHGRSGKPVVSLSRGRRLHHQGCVRVNPAMISSIESKPQDYYVSIHSAQYPAGAVRAQL